MLLFVSLSQSYRATKDLNAKLALAANSNVLYDSEFIILAIFYLWFRLRFYLFLICFVLNLMKPRLTVANYDVFISINAYEA